MRRCIRQCSGVAHNRLPNIFPDESASLIGNNPDFWLIVMTVILARARTGSINQY